MDILAPRCNNIFDSLEPTLPTIILAVLEDLAIIQETCLTDEGFLLLPFCLDPLLLRHSFALSPWIPHIKEVGTWPRNYCYMHRLPRYCNVILIILVNIAIKITFLFVPWLEICQVWHLSPSTVFPIYILILMDEVGILRHRLGAPQLNRTSTVCWATCKQPGEVQICLKLSFGVTSGHPSVQLEVDSSAHFLPCPTILLLLNKEQIYTLVNN